MSAWAQPRMTFGGQELYLTIAEKASASGFSLIKRLGHAAMETFQVASGEIGREAFTEWLRAHIVPRTRESRTD
ncbi:hypothetical protein D6779_07365 [Candidatus Parcubacteria bacterium]|nr:MAG: hypothetical protein D6779_07365 [Candidatus Parcubacteria bacterium]